MGLKCPVCLNIFVKNAIRHLVLSEKSFTFAAGKTAANQEVRYAIPIAFGRVALPAASFNALHPPSGLCRFRADREGVGPDGGCNGTSSQ